MLNWRLCHSPLGTWASCPRWWGELSERAARSPGVLRFPRNPRVPRKPTCFPHLLCRSAGGPRAYLMAVAECVAQSSGGTRPWRVRHRRCGILPRRFGGCLLLPLLGVSEFGRAGGGFSHKEHKAPQRKCATCAECCTMVLCGVS